MRLGVEARKRESEVIYLVPELLWERLETLLQGLFGPNWLHNSTHLWSDLISMQVRVGSFVVDGARLELNWKFGSCVMHSAARVSRSVRVPGVCM